MRHHPTWVIREDSFDPAHLHHHETLFTIGNGYLSTRGTFEEDYPGEEAATFIHGVFDDTPVFYTELVNAPNWTALEILLAGERFNLAQGEILAYERSLDLRNGLLARQVRWRSQSGRITTLRFERFASLANPHLLLVRLSITPLGYTGEIQVRAGLNAAVDTLGRLHWDWLGQEVCDQQTPDALSATIAEASLYLRTRKTGIEAAMAQRLAVLGGYKAGISCWDVHGHPTLAASVQASAGEEVAFEKIVAICTSHETPQPWESAREALKQHPVPAWKDCLKAHNVAWDKEWQACDVVIQGDDEVQRAARFNLFQLLIAAPRKDRRVSIGAKTLSGFGYRGHVFWDTEIFMLPFFTYTQPQIARNLLMYRYHTLPGARRKAQANGYKGAQFAWESAATGDEVTPVWVPHFQEPHNLVRIWTGDIEIHVSADVAYAIWQYWRATQDDDFLLDCGLEIILETARFWASRAECNETREHYEFNNVIGPDEYHDHVNNNAYTNYMARWHLLTARELLAWAQANYRDRTMMLIERLRIAPQEIEDWEKIAGRIYLPYDPQTSLIEQFDGYFKRLDVDLAAYAGRSQSMQAILGIEGVNQTQIIKQPDVLMLLYLLPSLVDENALKRNYEYYNARTDHTYGSSLGPAIQAIIACKAGRIEEAYQHFTNCAFSDLYDLRGNASDGIHGASAGGMWQALIFGFAGIQLEEDGFSVHPCLPAHWQRLEFNFTYQGKQRWVEITRNPQGYRVQVNQKRRKPERK